MHVLRDEMAATADLRCERSAEAGEPGEQRPDPRPRPVRADQQAVTTVVPSAMVISWRPSPRERTLARAHLAPPADPCPWEGDWECDEEDHMCALGTDKSDCQGGG